MEKVVAGFTSGLAGVAVAAFVFVGEVAIKPAVGTFSKATLPPWGRPEVPAENAVAVLFVKILVVVVELAPHIKLESPLTLILCVRLVAGLGCPCEA